MKRTTIQAANTSSAAQPTAEDVMAEFNASVPEQDRPAAARRLLAALDRIHPEDRPISAAVLWTAKPGHSGLILAHAAAFGKR